MRPAYSLALLAGATLVAFLALVWIFQRRLIYFPFPSRLETVPGLAYEEVSLRTEDGLDLGGWFVPGETGPLEGAAVLVCNGNAGSRSHRAPLAVALSRAGLSVLLFDYRGYGGNPGRPTERGLALDVDSALDHLRSRDDVDPRRVVYYGESLGSAVAVGLAARYPPAALILRSPFPSLVAVGRRHYPFLPVGTLLRDRFAAVEGIAGVPSPLLVVVGDADDVVSPELSRRLYDAATGTKQWLSIPGAGHNDWELLAGEELVEAVVEFVAARVGQVE